MSGCEDRFCILREESCDHRIKYLEANLKLQLDANEKAVMAAKIEMDRRLEGMNEFRSQLEKQSKEFLMREYYEREHQFIQKDINGLYQWKARTEGATSWGNIIAVMALAISAFFAVLHFVAR